MAGPVDDALAAHADTVRRAAEFVYAHPETAHLEHECAGYLAGTLEERGFAVERGVAGMETAFLAASPGEGQRVGLVAVYDAVATLDAAGEPVAVHSCGHGSIAGGVVGAALAAADLGRAVTVFGLPADELHAGGVRRHGGGKERSAAAGLWDGIDAALYAHPEFIDTVSQASLWGRHLELVVEGRRSLRAGGEHVALDALAGAVALGRRQPGEVMLERAVLDGDVEEGARMVLRAGFFVFAADEGSLEERTQQLRSSVEGGQWSVTRTIPAIVPDDRVTAAVAAAFDAAGRHFVADPPPLPFATDFGAISRVVPSALIGIGREGGWAFHTDEGAAQFTGPDGIEAALEVATVLAHAVAQLGG
jgi:metal-dependent amidase/aminoacylase/carboxypeptidase family protein